MKNGHFQNDMYIQCDWTIYLEDGHHSRLTTLNVIFKCQPTLFAIRSEMTLNSWMMVERYPNLKEEVGGLIPDYEISSLLDRVTCQVVICLLCFGVGL